jgi:hypothetical protein
LLENESGSNEGINGADADVITLLDPADKAIGNTPARMPYLRAGRLREEWFTVPIHQ